MRILLVPTSYPDEQNTTRNVFIYEQAVALSNAGHDIRVLHPQKLPSKRVLSRINYEIKTHYDGYAIRFSRPVKTFMEKRIVAFNKNLFINTIYDLYDCATLDGWKPDVIYAHFSCWAGFAAVELGKKNSIPVVVMEHFSGYMNEKSLSPKLIDGLEYVAKNADAFICVSNKLREKVIQLTNIKNTIHVIPNMIDSRFKYSRHGLNDKFVFVSVCILTARKRVKELVKAFCKAYDENDDVELIIGGDGPEREKIAAIIKENKRESQISMVGRLDRDGTVDLYKKADCFALVSAHETFGIVWREAMATGLPIITSNHEGWSSDDWSDDFGIMVPVDDENSLINALRDIKNNYDSYDGNKISSYCLEHYSDKTVVKQIEKVLESVC